MTMGSEEQLFSTVALPVIVMPILDKLEQRDSNAAQTLKSIFYKVEHQHPGFTYNFVKGILKKANVDDKLDMNECLLRLEGNNNSTEFAINNAVGPLIVLNERSINLKKILSRIPDIIYDRMRFLETIKDIASAIRVLLDTVNNTFQHIDDMKRPALEMRKKEFVKFSRSFSNTLKDFFRDNEKQCVFLSANHLIHQTNLLMSVVQESLKDDYLVKPLA